MMIVPSIPFVSYEFYTQYTPSDDSANQYLPKIVQHAANRQQWGALFPTTESVSQVVEVF